MTSRVTAAKGLSCTLWDPQKDAESSAPLAQWGLVSLSSEREEFTDASAAPWDPQSCLVSVALVILLLTVRSLHSVQNSGCTVVEVKGGPCTGLLW